VGDACQPLHVSFLHHGRPGHPAEEKVHGVYETTMLDRHAAELIQGVNDQLSGRRVTEADRFLGGRAAADATVELMRTTIKTLPPLDIINAYNEGSARDRVGHMWEVLGDRTLECVGRGALVLAAIWESAWREGGGAKIADTRLKKIQADPVLKRLYLDRTFVPAVWLKNLTEAELPGLSASDGVPAAPPASNGHARRRLRRRRRGTSRVRATPM
jgi:hypothetical protein